MVLPAVPAADLIVAQSGFALAALQAVLNAVLGLGHAGEFRGRGVRGALLR
jgi:hypothetical protein